MKAPICPFLKFFFHISSNCYTPISPNKTRQFGLRMFQNKRLFIDYKVPKGLNRNPVRLKASKMDFNSAIKRIDNFFGRHFMVRNIWLTLFLDTSGKSNCCLRLEHYLIWLIWEQAALWHTHACPATFWVVNSARLEGLHTAENSLLNQPHARLQ